MKVDQAGLFIKSVNSLAFWSGGHAECWVRLETDYLMEYSEEWRSDRSYIKREKAQEVMEHNRGFLTAQGASRGGSRWFRSCEHQLTRANSAWRYSSVMLTDSVSIEFINDQKIENRRY